MSATAAPKRGDWVTPAREAYLRQAWPNNVPRSGVAQTLALMEGPSVPSLGAIENFCTKTLGVYRTQPKFRAHWANEERKAYLIEAVPADKPRDEIMSILAAISGTPMPGWNTVQSYCIKRLKLHRTSRQALAVKAFLALRAQRDIKRRTPKLASPPPPPPPIEVRGTPGVALPPVAREWREIVAFGLRIGKKVAGRYDLPGLNRWRIAHGYAPLAIKLAGTWRPPSYKPWE